MRHSLNAIKEVCAYKNRNAHAYKRTYTHTHTHRLQHIHTVYEATEEVNLSSHTCLCPGPSLCDTRSGQTTEGFIQGPVQGYPAREQTNLSPPYLSPLSPPLHLLLSSPLLSSTALCSFYPSLLLLLSSSSCFFFVSLLFFSPRWAQCRKTCHVEDK